MFYEVVKCLRAYFYFAGRFCKIYVCCRHVRYRGVWLTQRALFAFLWIFACSRKGNFETAKKGIYGVLPTRGGSVINR